MGGVAVAGGRLAAVPARLGPGNQQINIYCEENPNMLMTAQQLVAEAKAQIREIDSSQAAMLLNEGALCLDVRESGEHEAERLHGAINIPRGVLEFRIDDHPGFADKNRTVLVYCKTGGRSALAALNLQRLGYRGVMSIAGGIEAWRNLGLPLQKDMNGYGNG
jgi:rhodanese-related sulfurtransferase